MNITVETSRQYLLERVGELKAQVPHGNPFVFLGAFSVLNAVGKVFDSSLYSLLADHFSSSEAEVISVGARRMFEGFTLTEEPSSYVNQYERTLCVDSFSISSGGERIEKLEKINLSHKDRDHLKRKNGRLTISAAAFLEDVETVINKAFDSVKDNEVAGARLFVKINEQPFIGYGD